MPSAFDEAGIRMLDSIREIFDILNIEFESVGFKLIEYNNFEQLSFAIKNRKCPVVDVIQAHIDPSGQRGSSHCLVATGIQKKNDIEYIQLKNAYADNPNEKGKVYLFS